jgi:hypothetical protein
MRCRFLPLIFLSRHSRSDRCASPFFGALDALAVHDGGRGRAVTSLQFANLLVEGKVQAVEHAVAVPAHEPAVHRAARRQVFGQSPPLAAGAQNVENCIEDLSQALRRRARLRAADEKGLRQIPFRIGQVAWVA